MNTSMTCMNYFNAMMPFTLVFEKWTVATQEQLICSCLGVALMSIVYEIVKNLRRVWTFKMTHRFAQLSPRLSMPTFCYACNDGNQTNDCGPPMSLNFWLAHTFQSVLHMAQIFLGYLLMLIAMSYNVWLFVSLVLGAGVGHLVAVAVYASPKEVTESSTRLISPDVQETKYKATLNRKGEEYRETISSEFGSYDNAASSTNN